VTAVRTSAVVLDGQHGLTRLYDAFAQEVTRAAEFRQRLFRRASPQRNLVPLNIIFLFPTLISLLQRWNVTGKASDALRQNMLDAATESEKGDELFPAVVSTYWVEALASHLLRTYALTSHELRGLRLVQTERESGLKAMHEWFRAGGILSVVVAVGAFAASELPQESFAKLGMTASSYAVYRLIVAGILVGVIGYLLLLRVLATGRTRKLRRQAEFVGSVLAYCAAGCATEVG